MEGFAAPPPAFTCSWHVALAETRKQEDASIVRSSRQMASGVSLWAVADGHNGQAAVRAVSALLPAELDRQLGLRTGPSAEAVRQALARAFLAIDDAVCRRFFQSGCTITAAVLSGDVLTVAHVGDSAALLDTGAEVVGLTAEHRIGDSPSELARLEAAGGRLSRLNQYGSGPSCGAHEGVGPVRLWPGGIMVSRAIGDRDVGAILLPHPHIRQVRIPPTGARLVLATDGLWDAMPAGRSARLLRQHGTAKAAAMEAVTAVANLRGGLLTDDCTVAVVDLLPPGARSFLDVLAQFQGRLRSVLSDPSLAALALEAVPAEEAEEPQQAKRRPPQPRRGLFACFGRPAVVEGTPAAPPDSLGGQREASAHSGRARSGSHELSARGAVAPDWSAYSGREASARGGSCRGSGRAGEWSARSGRALGGSERSVRGGIARDPSVRGCHRATTLEVLSDIDTAAWSPAEFGRAPSSPSCQPQPGAADPCSRNSRDSCSSAVSAQLSSPRGLMEISQALGASVDSLASDAEPELHLHSLLRTVSLASPRPMAVCGSLPRNASLPLLTDKKCRGGYAAAALLSRS